MTETLAVAKCPPCNAGTIEEALADFQVLTKKTVGAVAPF